MFDLLVIVGTSVIHNLKVLPHCKRKALLITITPHGPHFFKTDVPVEIIQALRREAKSIAEENDFRQ